MKNMKFGTIIMFLLSVSLVYLLFIGNTYVLKYGFFGMDNVAENYELRNEHQAKTFFTSLLDIIIFILFLLPLIIKNWNSKISNFKFYWLVDL